MRFIRGSELVVAPLLKSFVSRRNRKCAFFSTARAERLDVHFDRDGGSKQPSLFPKGARMRATNRIVAGRFCGGELEPGTFHLDPFRRPDLANQRGTDGAHASPDTARCGHAPGVDAVAVAAANSEEPALSRS